jgi:nucleoid DNA-binding protein/LysM repeat protein
MSVEPTYLFKKPTPPKAPVLDAEMMAFIDTIRAGLIRDGQVQLHQFGTFRLKWGKPRPWVNPRTGKAGMTGPIPRVTFAPAKHLRELIEPSPKPARPLDEGPERTVHIPAAIPVTPELQESQLSDNPRVQEPPSIDIPLEQKPSSIEIPLEKEYGVEDIDVENIDVETLDVENLDIENLDFAVAETEEEKPVKKRVRGWQLALLAAVPLIIMLLQSEFSGGTGTEAASISQPTPVVSQIQKAAPPQHPVQTAKPESHPDSRVAMQTESPVNNAGEKELSVQTAPAKSTTVDSASQMVADPSVAAQTQAPRQEDILYLEPSVHEVENGDSLWKLADEFLGDPYLWPYIYRANKGKLSDPDKLKAGMSLVIPGLQREPEKLTDNDSEHVAEGYYQLYRHYKSEQRRDAYFYLVGVRRFNNDVLQSHQAEIDPTDWEWATSVGIKAIKDNREHTSGKEVADLRQ